MFLSLGEIQMFKPISVIQKAVSFLFCTMTNKYTIISQIITFLYISTLSCHLQGACNQYLAKFHLQGACNQYLAK
jgi:hypothetical protein